MSDPLADQRIASGMRAQMALRLQRLSAGATQVGWKAGFGAPAAMQKLKIESPLVGFLLDRAILSSGATVSLAGWQKPVAEPEIAAYIGADLPARADVTTIRRAITAIGPAIEVADVDCAMDDVEAVLSGDIFNRHVVVGPRDIMRSGARLHGLVGRVTRNGEDVPVPADLETNTGQIVDIVRDVADMAAALGERLRAGQFVICGSLTAPMFLKPEDTDVEFSLAPIGAISVRFSS
jgi:2-keto-4-pentenoate hydratase